MLALALVAALGGVARADAIDDLASKLRSSEYKVRLAAALSLSRILEARAVALLVTAMGDSNQTVRGVAAAGLAKTAIRPLPAANLKAALLRLCTASKSDSSDFVKSQAAKAITTIAAAQGAKTPATPCTTGSSGTGPVGPVTQPGARYLIVPKVADQSKAALPEDIAYLNGEISKGLNKNTEFSAGTVATKVGAKQVGYEVAVNIKILSATKEGVGMKVACRTEGYVATYPGGSILTIGNMRMDAAVMTSKSEKDVALGKKDCLGGLADAIKDTVIKFAKSRP